MKRGNHGSNTKTGDENANDEEKEGKERKRMRDPEQCEESEDDEGLVVTTGKGKHWEKRLSQYFERPAIFTLFCPGEYSIAECSRKHLTCFRRKELAAFGEG